MRQAPFNQKLKVAVAGTGAVGRSLIERLLAEQAREGCPFELVAVSARRMRPWLKNLNVAFVDQPHLLAQQDNVDVIVEVLGGVQTAYDVVNTALTNGKHVVTANSTMLAGYGDTLMKIARMNNCYLGFEAAVLAGLPLRSFFTSMQQDLPRVTALFSSGLNRTLQRMQRVGERFDSALQVVQQDVAVDPSGKEDAYRLILLRALLYGRWSSAANQQGVQLAELDPADLALANHLGGVVQVLGLVNASGVSLQAMVLPEEHVLHLQSSKQESVLLELPGGAVQVTAPARSAAMAVESILNDLKAAQGGRAWKQRAPSQAQTDLATGCLFVRFNRVDQDLLRRDSRWSVLQERLDANRNKVGAIVATTLTPQQMMAALPNSLAMPVWQPAGGEVLPLDTPLRLVG